MKPQNKMEAIERIHQLLSAASSDLQRYLDDPSQYIPEYFESVLDVVLDAHLLVSWLKDAERGEQ